MLFKKLSQIMLVRLVFLKRLKARDQTLLDLSFSSRPNIIKTKLW